MTSPGDRRQDFVLEQRPTGGTTLVVTGHWSREAEAALLAGEADGLEVNYARGCAERDLRFVGEWPIRWLRIIERTLSDLDPIYRVADSLEELDVQAAAGASIDLRRLPNLKVLGAEWAPIRDTIESADLRELTVMKYSDPDFDLLARNSALSELEVKVAPHLTGVGGIENWPLLTRLSIFAAGVLQDLDPLVGASGNLRWFELEACPNMNSLTSVGHLGSLEFLGFSESGEIESVAAIGTLQSLSIVHAWGTTKILDADLVPLADLPCLRELRMRDTREYRPRVRDIQATLSTD